LPEYAPQLPETHKNPVSWGFYAIGLTHWSSETGFLPEYASQLPETHKNPVSKIPNRKSKIENPKSS
jgi:hypothetical protein